MIKGKIVYVLVWADGTVEVFRTLQTAMEAFESDREDPVTVWTSTWDEDGRGWGAGATEEGKPALIIRQVSIF